MSANNGSVNLEEHCPILWKWAEEQREKGLTGGVVPPEVLREIDVAGGFDNLNEEILAERRRQAALNAANLNFIVR